MNLTVKMTDTEKIFGWVLLALHLLFLPYIILLICMLFSVELTNATLNIAVFITAFVLTVSIFFRFLWRNLQIFLQNKKKCIYAALGGFGIYYVANIFVGIIIQNLSPSYTNANDANIQQMTTGYYGMILFCTVVLVPVTEEVLYRGMLFGLIRQKSRVLAYVLSVLIFAAIHVIGYIGQLTPLQIFLAILQYIPASISLAYAYEVADSIWAPILIHSFINLIGMLAMR